ncbi:MAG: PD-(D/E)XK nuclease family protein [Candidatus Nealsonbacteria bacterium]|nr:MAG: PD-(D/E)XK nuclease family protein [Candidatus Nealsonbacteria bacterium]
MLKKLINQFYLDRQKDRERTRFYITDAGKCPRAIFYKFKKAPKEDMEARILRLFEHGDYIHQLIMKPLLSLRKIHVVASEVNIPPKELIAGRADAIISDGKDLYIVDIKSMNSMIFRNLKEPKVENVDQLQLYLHFFKVSKGILLYVNKDSQELKEFLVDYDKNRARGLLKKLTELKRKIDSNIIPSQLADYPLSWQCRYCPFKEVCQMTGGGNVNWEEFKKRIQAQNKTA